MRRHLALLSLTLVALVAGCAKSIPEWRSDLASPDPHTRMLAALALCELDAARALPALRILFESFDTPKARERAAVRRALQSTAPHHLPALVEVLVGMEGEPQILRDPVNLVLERQGAPVLDPLLEALPRCSRSARESLEGLLLKILRSDEQARLKLEQACSEAEGATAGPLLELLKRAEETPR